MTIVPISAANGGPLLTYALQLQPDPLQADSPAVLSLVVSNATDDSITCYSIQITLPVGNDATDLIDGSATISCQPASGWSANVEGGVVTVTPPGGSAVIEGSGLVFVIATTLNAQPGTATITLAETASDDGGPQQQGSGSFAVNKFPADFSLSDLMVVPTNNLDIPYGQPAQLTWTAIGAGVSCTLEYQPSDAGDPVLIPVPNTPAGGFYQTEPLTRSEGVIFTLFAQVKVLGQDNPLMAQRQLAVTVDTMSLSAAVLPPRVAVNGLVMLQWTALNADHCLFEDGTTLATSGTRYAVVAASKTYTVTAVGKDGRIKQAQPSVTVDPSIGPTETGHSLVGEAGSAGAAGGIYRQHTTEGWTPFYIAAGNGGNGTAANLAVSLPPLDTTGSTARVIPISVTGGPGGSGGNGNGAQAGNGGNGGDASLTATFDLSQSQAAQYIITLAAGAAGGPGSGGGSSGSAGAVTGATINGQTLYLPGAEAMRDQRVAEVLSAPALNVASQANRLSDPNAPLLAYSLIPKPDPLSVASMAQLTLVVSNPQDGPVTCTGIVLTLPVGNAGTDLTDGKSQIDKRPADGWTADASGGVITFTPPGGSAVIQGAGLTFIVAMMVNDQPGTTTIQIDESATSGDPKAKVRTSTIPLGKFPADFSLSDLTSVPPERLDIPFRKTATLMWTATGEKVSCTLSYQPSDEETWVSQNVSNTGPITSVQLTRTGGVLFTLIAQVTVLGQDNPLVAQKQLQLAIDTLSLTFEAQPPSVAPNGLVRLRWHAPNADHCTLEDGMVLPASGAQLFILQQSRRFVLTAHGSGGAERQSDHSVEVDPSIQANQPAITLTGRTGDPGPPGGFWPAPGGRGGDAILTQLPPLDETSKPSRVIPIVLNGGQGGPGAYKSSGHRGGGSYGPGGTGGDAGLDVTFDGAGDPAQYVIVTLNPGPGGFGSITGAPGSVRLNVHDTDSKAR